MHPTIGAGIGTARFARRGLVGLLLDSILLKPEKNYIIVIPDILGAVRWYSVVYIYDQG